MTVIISGTDGINTIQDGTVSQSKLAANVVGKGPAFSAYNGAFVSIANATSTKVTLGIKNFDYGNYYDISNSRYTPLVAGVYRFSACIQFGGGTGLAQMFTRKNGSTFKAMGMVGNNASGTQLPGSTLVELNGTTDYVELWCYQNSGGSLNVGSNISDLAFEGTLERAA